MVMTQAESALLERAAPYLREPTNGAQAHGGSREIVGGVLDLLGRGPARRGFQTALDWRPFAWGYDRLRETVLPTLFGIPSWAEDVARLRERLDLQRGDVLLDLACGHGNFTMALAESVGPQGLVIGVDISRAMLSRAAARVRERNLGNVLLVLGDAQVLPIADRSIPKLNCSGGFHTMPNLPMALAELARVAQPGAPFTTTTFARKESEIRRGFEQALHRYLAMNFVPLDWLGVELAGLGFEGYASHMEGGLLGYAHARMRGGGARAV